MASTHLSRHDNNVLEKIKDPESNPSTAVLIDPSLPKDPHLTDTSVYDRVSRREREVIHSMQQLEMQLAGLNERTLSEPVTEYHKAVSELDDLVSEYPDYASARNNRAQALRRLYGDTMLLSRSVPNPRALVQDATESENKKVVEKALDDLDEAIKLLSPRSLFASLSPQAAKTLSLAHTQRAAIYHMTSKLMVTDRMESVIDRRETRWTKLQFEEAASKDFALGGRYGNEIAKGLAVSTNPTAKLCGQMVREAMKKEYGPSFEA